MFGISDPGNNYMGEKGCEYLLKYDGNRLSRIQLSTVHRIKENNQIGFKGCKFIAQAKWPLLKTLSLSIRGIK